MPAANAMPPIPIVSSVPETNGNKMAATEATISSTAEI